MSALISVSNKNSFTITEDFFFFLALANKNSYLSPFDLNIDIGLTINFVVVGCLAPERLGRSCARTASSVDTVEMRKFSENDFCHL